MISPNTIWILRGWLELAGLLKGSGRLCGLGAGHVRPEAGKQQQCHSPDAPATAMCLIR